METDAGHGFGVRTFSGSDAIHWMDVCKDFQPPDRKRRPLDRLRSFAFLGINDYTEILSPILIIGFVSFVMSLIGLFFGIKCGCGCARKLKAELWGGIILVAIGLKILIEHLFLQ